MIFGAIHFQLVVVVNRRGLKNGLSKNAALLVYHYQICYWHISTLINQHIYLCLGLLIWPDKKRAAIAALSVTPGTRTPAPAAPS
jgi:hypothetical protein